MKVNEEKLNRVFQVICSSRIRPCLLALAKDEPLTYSQLAEKWMTERTICNSKTLTDYYLRRLLEAKMVTRRDKYYILTRIGVESIRLLEAFKKICMDYELDDCDADGMIKVMVVDRKLGRRKLEFTSAAEEFIWCNNRAGKELKEILEEKN